MEEKQKTRYHLDNRFFRNPVRYGDVDLIQIGRRFCEPTEVIAAHPHLNWYELTIVTGGKATICTNGEGCEVSAGDIYLSFPCDVHEIRVDGKTKLEYDFFAFFCEEGPFAEELVKITRHCRLKEQRVFRDEKISALVADALTEISDKSGPYSDLALCDLLQLILIYLLRDFGEEKKHTKNVSDTEILCFQMMNYIDTHLYSLSSLQEIGQNFNYNYTYLSGLFRKTTGRTLTDYFRQRKMDTAKALILENKKKIGEIADMLHYTLYSFSKAFKETYGVSPQEMRKLSGK